ncbi:hypothetical protein NA56DRAFT_711115 [Hyaloscypha hepaticicola]|uniref:Uncharacterized protein n=1 Tax=Hyaloscypha hepaticicola TaxID=2082293 RepID=A0A2J6PJW5_9HELO|nr:hypothetical protein NA56DRAFT_711115 [Hyaloscypha hepaticicola]
MIQNSPIRSAPQAPTQPLQISNSAPVALHELVLLTCSSESPLPLTRWLRWSSANHSTARYCIPVSCCANRCGFRPAAEPLLTPETISPPDPILQLPEKLVEYWKCQLCPTVKSDGRPICMNSPGDELPKVGAVDHLASRFTTNAAFITHQTEHQAMGSWNRFPSVLSHPMRGGRSSSGVCGPERLLPSSLPSLGSLEFPTAISYCAAQQSRSSTAEASNIIGHLVQLREFERNAFSATINASRPFISTEFRRLAQGNASCSG